MIISASAEAKRGMGCSHGVWREPDTKISPLTQKGNKNAIIYYI